MCSAAGLRVGSSAWPVLGRVDDAHGAFGRGERRSFGTGSAAMTLIWKDKKNDERISGRDVNEVFGQYIQELEALARAVDQL